MKAKESVKRNSAIWLSDIHTMTDGSLLLCKIGNDYLEGTVTLTAQQIAVTMIVPFPDKKKTAVLEIPINICFVDSKSDGCVASEYGRLRAQELLLDIFFDCQ